MFVFYLTALLRRRGVGIVHRRQLCLRLSSIFVAKTASPSLYFSVLIDQWAVGHAVGEVLEPHCCKTRQITTNDSMCCTFWTGCYSSAWTFKPTSTQTLWTTTAIIWKVIAQIKCSGTVSHNKEAIVNWKRSFFLKPKHCRHKTGMYQTFVWRIQIQANANVNLC